MQYIKNKYQSYHLHQLCVTPENFTKHGMDKYLKIITTNQDVKNENLTFVSTYQHQKYPFYAVQWHPEKPIFEFGAQKPLPKLPHGFEDVRVGQYLANFFVNEARKSNHTFPDRKTEVKSLIHNYEVINTNKYPLSFYDEVYVIPLGKHTF